MANKKEYSASTPIVGLNKDSHPSRVEQGEYSHATNTNISTKDGMEYYLTSEPSNLLVSKLKEGFRVVGHKANYNSGIIYYFIVNPTTGVSEIGKVRTVTDSIDLEQSSHVQELNDTDNELSDITQVPFIDYETIISDDCNGCLGFDTTKPIHTIVLRPHESGDKLTWTFGEMPMTLDMGKLEELGYTGHEGCVDDNREETCLDCDKLRVLPRYSKAIVTPDTTISDGNLRRGTYEIWMAYCSQDGVETSEYFSQTTSINIFDVSDNNFKPEDIDGKTRYGIKVKLDGLDQRNTHYKLVASHTTTSGVRFWEVGVYDISTDQVTINQDLSQNHKEVAIDKVYKDKTPIYKTSERVRELNGMLLHINTKQEVEWNLQPVVNLMGAFAEWATIEASENFYKTPLPSSRMKSRMRDEVYAEGIRFHTDYGYTTPEMPLVSRPARDWEKERVITDVEDPSIRLDVKSIKDGMDSCDESDRNEVWQYENTAGEGVISESYKVNSNIRTSGEVDVYTITGDPVTYIVDPSTLTNSTGPAIDRVDYPFNFVIDVTLFGEQYDLQEFINENYNRIIAYTAPGRLQDTDRTILYLRHLLTSEYTGSDTPEIEEFGHDGNCEGDTITGTCCEIPAEDVDAREIEIGESSNEERENEYLSVNEYPNIPSPESCHVIRIDSEGVPVQAQDLHDYTDNDSGLRRRSRRAYERMSGGTSDIPTSPVEIYPYDKQAGTTVMNYFLDYEYSIPDNPDDLEEGEDPVVVDCPSDLLSTNYYGLKEGTRPAGKIQSEFHSNPTTTAAWFKLDISGKEEVVIGVSSFDQEHPRRSLFLNAKHYRLSIFNNPSESTPIYSEIYNIDNSVKIGVDLTGEMGSQYGYIDKSSEVTGNSLYVVIDAPIRSRGTYCWIDSPEACFSIAYMDTKIKSTSVTFDDIALKLKQRFVTTCTYNVPQPDDCKPQIYKTGEFAYTESTEKYPNNKELYDSSWLNISRKDIPTEVVSKFEEFYTEDGQTVGGRYVLKGADFTCQNIRHFKYPDVKKSPIMPNYRIAEMGDTTVFPIGFLLDRKVVDAFLDVAVNNKLITKEQKDSITGYELLVADRQGNKSVLAKGIGFDMYKYKEERDIYFSNFPYNTLGDNELLMEGRAPIKHPNRSESNSRFSVMTPSLYMGWNETPTEMKLEGYMLGNSENMVTETKEHPKWVVLGPRAKSLATTLAAAEVTTELLMDALAGLETMRFGVGVYVSANPFGAAQQIYNVITATTQSVARLAQYRYQWLETFENIGTPINFASRISGVGKYTNMITNVDSLGSRNALRGLMAAKKMEPSTEIITNNKGERTYINNISREQSIYVQTTEEVEYTSMYKNYDNTSINRATSSRFIQSDTGLEENKTVIRNIASPYISLKNYIPNQYGKISNLSWHTTGKVKKLRLGQSLSTDDMKEVDIDAAFGGDIYISRFADIRKAELFRQSAMGLADRTPFEYSRYPNYGDKVTYYLDHKINEDLGIKSQIIPDISNKYNLDMIRSSGNFYIKDPAKFYTHFHGIVNFIVETEYNPNYRYSIDGDDSTIFYPQTTDYKALTEPISMPLTRKSTFNYSSIFSRPNQISSGRPMPTTYNKEEARIKAEGKNTIVASQPDIGLTKSSGEYIETSMGTYDPWKIYKSADFLSLSTTDGYLKDAIRMESDQLLLRFENNMSVLNAQADQREGKSTRGVNSLRSRPIEFTRSIVGYGGTENTASLPTDFGQIMLDTKRGDIFVVRNVPGKMPELTNIAESYNNKPTKMKRWFQRNLPFKVKTSLIENYNDIDIDNNYNGIGISIGYDNIFKRVWISKKDFVPLRSDITADGGKIYDISQEAIDALIADKEALGYTFVSRQGGKLIFTREEEDSYEECLGKIKFIVEYRANSAESPCGGGHTCNRAVFDLVINGITVGQVNMNNTGGAYDDENRPADHSSLSDRYSEVTLTQEQITQILEVSNLLDISLECACVTGVNCQSANCHTSVSWLRLEIDDEVIYSDCPAGSFIEDYDACSQTITTTIVTEEFLLPEMDLKDETVFEDVGWTISFDFRSGRWISFFDFRPDWYVSLPEYAMTGYNTNNPEVYIHNMTNRSFQNYNGIQHPWLVDVLSEHSVNENRIESVSYIMESYRHDYGSYGNYILNNRIGMDEAIVYGTNNNSGILKLEQVDTPNQMGAYPIQVDSKTQAIPQTLVGGKWSFNYFFNRLVEGRKMWTVERDGHTRNLEGTSLSYNRGPILHRMDGRDFSIEYKSYDSKHEKNFRINLNKLNTNVR